MQSYATVGRHRIALTPLDVIRVVATHNGLEDVDCEPDVTGFKVTASAPGRSVTVRGDSLESVCERFCDQILG